MKFSTWMIVLVTIGVNLLIWTTINKPYNTVETSYPINSVSFNPYKKNQSPYTTPEISPEQLEEDLKAVEGKARTIRLYSSMNGLDRVPELAKEHNIQVVASAFIDDRQGDEKNDADVLRTIELAGKNKNVSRVIIGNETQLHKTVPVEKLKAYLQMARKKLKTPVSTAEPWDFWIQHPDFVDEVDYIAIHILPYWVEVPIDQAVDYVVGKYLAVKNMFPKKYVYIAETGWPSDGPQRGAAEATLKNQADFVRRFVQRAEEEKIPYNIIEAFDQPWKSVTEGNVGEHWGLMDADRHDKFPLQGPVLEDPKWKYWAISSSVLGFLGTAVFLSRRRDLKKRGQFISMAVFQGLAAFSTQMARQASNQYMSPGDIVFWGVMITAHFLLAILMVTDAMEIADVVGDKPLKRKFLPSNVELEHWPFVSLHVACCNEPPDMMIQTVDSLASLDYPNYEIMVIDNNTMDPAVWKPLQEHCATLGDKVRFFTLGKHPGFKAGALNFALRNMDPRTEVVGVVDADYIVSKNWLKATVPYFVEDPEVALVQAPQEHRDWNDNVFQRMENDEYSGFFRIGMVQRNEDNAIIQHGTMTLVDRKMMDKLGGWAEWCICEDTELGLRILNEKKKTVYLDHPFGHGLVPDTYEAYAKQRFRWAYGGMRIFRHHIGKIMGITGHLTWSQRYQFMKGWIPWMGESLHMVFTLTALGWSALLLAKPLTTEFPEPIFIYPALMLVVLRILGTMWTYRARVKIGRKRTLLAMMAGGSLTHKIAKAVLQGLFFFSVPFYRTPKMADSMPVFKALASVWQEFVLAMSLYVGAWMILKEFGTINYQAIVWAIGMIVQSFPYLAAIGASLVSSFSRDTSPEPVASS